MAFTATHVTAQDGKGLPPNTISPLQNLPQIDPYELEGRELALLLELVKKHTFLGEQVELVYNTALKLQQQYVRKTK